MTDAKKYLQQIKRYDVLIKTKLEELQNLKELVTKITATIKDDVVSGGSNQDKLSDAAARIVDLENEIALDVYNLVAARKDVVTTIDAVKEQKKHTVLCERYLEYKTWEQIACDMNISYQWVCELHGRALQDVEKILKKSATVDRS